MNIVPDRRSLADLDAGLDDRGRVDADSHRAAPAAAGAMSSATEAQAPEAIER